MGKAVPWVATLIISHQTLSLPYLYCPLTVQIWQRPSLLCIPSNRQVSSGFPRVHLCLMSTASQLNDADFTVTFALSSNPSLSLHGGLTISDDGRKGKVLPFKNGGITIYNLTLIKFLIGCCHMPWDAAQMGWESQSPRVSPQLHRPQLVCIVMNTWQEVLVVTSNLQVQEQRDLKGTLSTNCLKVENVDLHKPWNTEHYHNTSLYIKCSSFSRESVPCLP